AESKRLAVRSARIIHIEVGLVPREKNGARILCSEAGKNREVVLVVEGVRVHEAELVDVSLICRVIDACVSGGSLVPVLLMNHIDPHVRPDGPLLAILQGVVLGTVIDENDPQQLMRVGLSIQGGEEVR